MSKGKILYLDWKHVQLLEKEASIFLYCEALFCPRKPACV